MRELKVLGDGQPKLSFAEWKDFFEQELVELRVDLLHSFKSSASCENENSGSEYRRSPVPKITLTNLTAGVERWQ